MKYYCTFFIAAFAMCLWACAPRVTTVKQDTGKPYTVRGKTYTPLKKVASGHFQKGIASWYGPGFHGKKTSSGEIYDMHSMTAAHNVLPLHSVVKVTNLANNKAIVVRINDRGPFIDDRVIDLSFSAAKELGMLTPGTVPVALAVLETKDTKRPPQHLAQAPRTQDKRGPNPFYVHASQGLLALSRN